MITRENYEIYFIDYFDNNLTAQTTEELFLFLDHNQDLKEEFENFNNIELVSVNTNNFDKQSIIKTDIINESNEEYYIIGHLEANLSKEEEKYFALYLLEYPHKQELLTSFSKTILKAPFIPFPNKKSLKQKDRVLSLFSYGLMSAIAASIALVLFFNFLNTNQIKGNSLSKFSINTRVDREIINETLNIFDTTLRDINDIHTRSSQSNIKKRNKEDLITTNKSISLTNEIATNTDLVDYHLDHVFEPIVLEEDKSLKKNVSNTNVLTPGEFAMRKISKLILNEEKEKIEAKDVFASLGVDIVDKPKEDESKGVSASKQTDNNYFKIKIGKFSFKRKKRK